jgi:hypothetical protein
VTSQPEAARVQDTVAVDQDEVRHQLGASALQLVDQLFEGVNLAEGQIALTKK